MADSHANIVDGWADAFYSLDPSSAMEMQNIAEDLRQTARESHDYSIYFVVGALLAGIGGVGWMAWSIRERRE